MPSTRHAPGRLLVGLGLALGLVALVMVVALVPQQRRTTPVYDPPVLAGQQLWGACAGGFFARLGDQVVVTSSGHCAAPGTTAYEADGTTVRGVFGPPARSDTCPVAGRTCAASDMNYLVVAADRVPWGRLNLVDLGTGGYRAIEPGTEPLRCDDIAIGDPIEINGRDRYRTGTVAEKGENDFPDDPMYFPCMIGSMVEATVGDSGGAVLVRGLPAGVSSRSFAGHLGFTPLAEGLEELGLELCTEPDCGLAPPDGASTQVPSATGD